MGSRSWAGQHAGPGRTVGRPFGPQAVEQPARGHHRFDAVPGPGPGAPGGSGTAPGQAGGDLGGDGFRVVADLVDQPERQRLGRLHPAAGQHQVHRRGPADQVGQQPGAHGEIEAGRPGPAQPRRGPGDPQVGRGGQLRAAAHRRPGQHGDHRAGPGDDGLAAVVDQVGDGGPFGIGDGQVRPGAEHPRIGAGQQDRHAGLGGQDLGDRAQQAHVERITPNGPGQAHPPVASGADLDGQMRMRHARAPGPRGLPKSGGVRNA